MPDGPVAVVVLNWNGREDTLACLRSLERASGELVPIVVDNGSTDGSVAAVREAFPAVEIVETGANLGFAGGNNAGIARALELGAAHVIVVNNDVEVDPGFATALVAEAGRRPDAGALCSMILYAEPRDTIWFAGASFDPRAGYNGRQRGYGKRDDGAFDAVTATDRACGAAMLVPRAVLEQVGLFDPAFFLYSEDTEWSLRAREAGFNLYVVPASKVRHKVSAGSGGESSPSTLYYDMRNTLVVCERHAPLGRFGTWRRRLLMLVAHLAQAVLSTRRRSGVGAVWQGYRDGVSGKLGPRMAR
jgi:GT2 family glycosyltransferase